MSSLHPARPLHDNSNQDFRRIFLIADFKARSEKAIAEFDEDTVDELLCDPRVDDYRAVRFQHRRNNNQPGVTT